MSNIRYRDFKPSYDDENNDITQAELFEREGDIFDLADAFLSIESMTHKKLQKLCYYAKAWYLALYDENLVTESFEGWVHGAVQPDLYQKYKPYGFSYIPRVLDTEGIPEEFMNFARQIFLSYGDLDGDDLERLNHTEMPWINSRGNLKPWQTCERIISEDDMKNYYRSLM